MSSLSTRETDVDSIFYRERFFLSPSVYHVSSTSRKAISPYALSELLFKTFNLSWSTSINVWMSVASSFGTIFATSSLPYSTLSSLIAWGACVYDSRAAKKKRTESRRNDSLSSKKQTGMSWESTNRDDENGTSK